MPTLTTLTVVIPTISRLTLAKTLESVLLQLKKGDQIIVVGDGEQPAAHHMVVNSHFRWDLLSCPVCGGDVQLLYVDGPSSGTWGHAQRNIAIERYATGSYITFIDDDDVWAAGARDAIETSLTDDTQSVPRIFRMVTPDHRILWIDEVLRQGNVGTPMFVVPNDPNRIGRFSSRYEGDFDFIKSCRWPETDILWEPAIICICRP